MQVLLSSLIVELTVPFMCGLNWYAESKCYGADELVCIRQWKTGIVEKNGCWWDLLHVVFFRLRPIFPQSLGFFIVICCIRSGTVFSMTCLNSNYLLEFVIHFSTESKKGNQMEFCFIIYYYLLSTERRLLNEEGWGCQWANIALVRVFICLWAHACVEKY